MRGTLLVASLFLAARVSAAAPALAVVISVDQMRADYLTRFGPEFKGGFARLLRDGAVYTAARQGHVPTETAPGHAALLTGCFPAKHGIIGNAWWDRAEGKEVKSVDGPGGAQGPGREMCPTLGDALKKSRPESRVVSVGGKSRVAILMGGRTPDLALWYDWKGGRFGSSAYYAPLPSWLEDWNKSNEVPAGRRESLPSTSEFDARILSLSSRAVDEVGLGRGRSVDLLLVGLSATDILGHEVGPDSPKMREQILALDALLGSFFDSLDRRIGPGRWTVALSADHGVTPLPEESKAPGAERVLEDRLVEEAEGFLRRELGVPPAGAPRWLLAFHAPHAWLAGPKALPVARKFFSARRYVERVYDPKELAAPATKGPRVDEFRRSVYPGRSGDLLVLFKPGVIMAEGPHGTTHGRPDDDDARVPLILMGAGVKPGVHGEETLATDLAPTLAKLVGADLKPSAPSRVLTEALAAPLPKR